MTRRLLECVKANLLYYTRNRLLILLVIISTLLTGLTLLFSVAVSGRTQKLETVVFLYHTLTRLGSLVLPVMALVTISQPLANRSIKMVLTKPCPLEIWMASHFFSTGLVALAVYSLAFLTGGVLFLAWGIPFQTGLFFLAIYEAAASMMTVSTILLLTTVFNPVIAFAALLISRDALFTALAQSADWAASSRAEGFLKLIFQGIRELSRAIAFALPPAAGPYAEQMKPLSHSLRMDPGTFHPLLLGVLYCLVFSIFCWAAGTRLLRRRPLT